MSVVECLLPEIGRLPIGCVSGVIVVVGEHGVERVARSRPAHSLTLKQQPNMHFYHLRRHTINKDSVYSALRCF